MTSSFAFVASVIGAVGSSRIADELVGLSHRATIGGGNRSSAPEEDDDIEEWGKGVLAFESLSVAWRGCGCCHIVIGVDQRLPVFAAGTWSAQLSDSTAMFTTLRQVARQRALYIQTSTCSRYYATETNIPAASDVKEGESSEKHRYELFLERKAKEPPTRPQLKVGTDGKHGLYAFFRSVPTSDGTSTIFETVEASSKPTTKTGAFLDSIAFQKLTLLSPIFNRPCLECCRTATEIIQGSPYTMVYSFA